MSVQAIFVAGRLQIRMRNFSILINEAKSSDEYICRGVIGYDIEVLSRASAEEGCDWWEETVEHCCVVKCK